ncbi:MAG: hypothetical protein EXR25_10265 [Limnohabitans sp.]|nr:hypothetical protein [Limnohabitans sp.]
MSDVPPFPLDATQLQALAIKPLDQCACSLKICKGWESVSDDRWPSKQLKLEGTLRREMAQGESELSFQEFHPNGTRYDSPEAPIALNYFPYNRADVYACQQCGCAVLKYTEYGGYYIDQRVRLVDACLVVDAA